MTEPQPKLPQTTPSTLRRTLRGLLRLLGSIVITFIIMLILSYFLIQIPAVQTWAAQQVTESLSEELETTVTVERVSISLFDKLRLDKFYLEDQTGDTLLYAKELRATFNTDLYTLLQGSLEVEGVSLSDATIAIRQDSGFYNNNLQFILDHFAQPPEPENVFDPQAKPFDINIRNIQLNNVRFRQENAVNGKNFYVQVPQGIINLNILSLPNKLLDVQTFDLQRPVIHVVENEANPLPELPVDPDDIIEIQTPDSIYLDTLVWVVKVENFELLDGDFKLNNYRNNPIDVDSKEILDYAHLELFDINIDIEELTYSDWDWQAAIGGISFEEKTGFKLEELSADTAHLSPEKLEFFGLKLETPHTTLGDTLIFTYGQFPDFRDFPNQVDMDLRFKAGSRVKMDDIMTFAPNLERNPFFINNRERVIDIEGRVYGKISNLKGRNIDIELDDGTVFRGDFRTRDLNDRNNEFVNLDLEEFSTSISDLRNIIPNLRLPPNFDKLGNLRFNGKFTGFFEDFVANGTLQTDLGSATTDMRLDLKEGRNVAKYSGELSLNNFDLARWADNPDFGKVTFNSEVKNGIGLTAREASANLIANITRFPFKGYAYENATFNGQLNQNLFDGDFSIKDDNIDFIFAGRIDITDSIPKLDFQASVNRLAMQPLNLSKKNYVLGGNIDLQVKNVDLALLEGRVDVGQFTIIHNDTSRYVIDTVQITSTFDEANNRDFRIRSDVLDSEIIGEFNIEKLPQTFIHFFTSNYPEFAHRLGVQSRADSLASSHFTYNIRLKDSKGLNYLINPKLDSIKNVTLRGDFDGRSSDLKLKLNVPAIRFGNLYFEDIALDTDAEAADTYMDLVVNRFVLNDKQEFRILKLYNHLDRDTMDFSIFHEDTTAGFVKKLDLNGKFFLSRDSLFQITFNSTTNSNIALGSDNWEIDKDNYIRFGKGRVETNNFELTDGERQVFIESYGETGLSLALNNMDFAFINRVWVFPKFDFKGRFNFSITADDVFKLADLEARATMDSLFINEDYFGRVGLKAEAANIRSKAEAELEIKKGDMRLLFDGTYTLPNYQSASFADSEQPNYMNFDLDIKQYPVNILEYLIGDAISNTVGKFDIDANFKGSPKRPDASGKLRMYETAVTLDYLNLRMFVNDDTATITNSMIDATGGVIRDRAGNEAYVMGGLTHNHLKEWGLGATVTTSKFIGLDTKKGDNPIYYGKAIGQGTVQFTGTFQRPNIEADVTAGRGSQLYLPLSSTYEAGEVSFIRFIDKNKPKAEQTENSAGFFSELKGLSFRMDLTITDEARGEIIFDEQAGDIIKGRGNGTIQMVVPRGGELSMYGDFEITEGEYLFTLLNFINKPFVVREGGTIRWNGDPYNAKINLRAEYKNLSTPIANFIQEYIQNVDQRILADANRPTDVDLEMILTGDLLTPTINFDINFPSLNGPLRTYVETKMRTLTADQNELNRQVFGLIVLGQFLPSESEYNFTPTDLAFNTITEMLSSQLSILATELLSDVLVDGNIIRSVDFDFAYNRYDNSTASIDDLTRGSEVQARIRGNILTDRLSLILGGNVDLQNGNTSFSQNNDSFFGGDVVLEYYLNASRTLLVRAYYVRDQDFATGLEDIYGTGLSYRQEFDSFRELVGRLLKKKK